MFPSCFEATVESLRCLSDSRWRVWRRLASTVRASGSHADESCRRRGCILSLCVQRIWLCCAEKCPEGSSTCLVRSSVDFARLWHDVGLSRFFTFRTSLESLKVRGRRVYVTVQLCRVFSSFMAITQVSLRTSMHCRAEADDSVSRQTLREPRQGERRSSWTWSSNYERAPHQ